MKRFAATFLTIALCATSAAADDAAKPAPAPSQASTEDLVSAINVLKIEVGSLRTERNQLEDTAAVLVQENQRLRTALDQATAKKPK